MAVLLTFFSLLGQQENDPRPLLHTLSPAARKELARLLAAHATPELLDHHHAWHRLNGSGGTKGVGSGKLFLEFHREMIRSFEQYMNQNKSAALTVTRMPEWDTTRSIPREFKDPQPKENPRRSQRPNFRPPTWATLKGGIEKDPLFGYTKLSQFRSTDELGRALATPQSDGTSYHARGHVKVGGTMATFGSPADPIFFAWHGQIDRIWADWQTTENGMKERQSQPAATRAFGLESRTCPCHDEVVERRARQIRALGSKERERRMNEPLFEEPKSFPMNGSTLLGLVQDAGDRGLVPGMVGQSWFLLRWWDRQPKAASVRGVQDKLERLFSDDK